MILRFRCLYLTSSHSNRVTDWIARSLRREQRRAVDFVALDSKISLVAERADAVTPLKCPPKGIGAFVADIARHVFDTISRNSQTTPCFIESQLLDKNCRRRVKEAPEEATKMARTQTNSPGQRLY